MRINNDKNIENIQSQLVRKKEYKKTQNEQTEQEEPKQAAPNNPAFYSSYLGINKKVSFGASEVFDTPEKRKNYFISLQKADGTKLIDDIYLYPPAENTDDEDWSVSRTRKDIDELCNNQSAFQLCLELLNITRKDGSKLFGDEDILLAIDSASGLLDESLEESEFYGKKAKINLDKSFFELVNFLVEEKNDGGEYLFDADTLLEMALILNMLKGEHTTNQDIFNYYKEAKELKDENNNPLQVDDDFISLVAYKVAFDNDFNMQENYPKLLAIKDKYKDIENFNLSLLDTAIINSFNENETKYFDALLKSNQSKYISTESLIELAQKIGASDEPQKTFDYAQNLLNVKTSQGESCFSYSQVSKILSFSDKAKQKIETVLTFPESESRDFLLNSILHEDILNDDEKFGRLKQISEAKNSSGKMLVSYYSNFVSQLLSDDKSFETFKKYAATLSDMGFWNIDDFILGGEEQCQKLIDLMQIKDEEGNPRIYHSDAQTILAFDDETQASCKNILNMGLSHYYFSDIVKQSPETIKKYEKVFPLLLSSYSTFDGSLANRIAKSSDDKYLTRLNELLSFKDLEDKPRISVYSLEKFIFATDDEYKDIIDLLSMKTEDGKDMNLSYQTILEMVKKDKQVVQNFKLVAPELLKYKDSNDRNLFTFSDVIDIAALGEEAFALTKQLLAQEGTVSTLSAYNNSVVNIVKSVFSTKDSNVSTRLYTLLEQKNKYGENLISSSRCMQNMLDWKGKDETFDEMKNRIIQISEMRSYEDSSKPLFSDYQLVDFAGRSDLTPEKIKDYADKLIQIEDKDGKYWVSSAYNIANLILMNKDLSSEELCQYIKDMNEIVSSRKTYQGGQPTPYDYDTVISYGKDFCSEVKNIISILANEKDNWGSGYRFSNWNLQTLLRNLKPNNIENIKNAIEYKTKTGEYILRQEAILDKIISSPEQAELIIKYAPQLENEISLFDTQYNELIQLFAWDHNEAYYQNIIKLAGIKVGDEPLFDLNQLINLCNNNNLTPERMSVLIKVLSDISQIKDDNAKPLFNKMTLINMSYYLTNADLTLDVDTYEKRVITLAKQQDGNSEQIWDNHLSEIANDENKYNRAMSYVPKLIDTTFNPRNISAFTEMDACNRETVLFDSLELTPTQIDKFIDLSLYKNKDGNIVFDTYYPLKNMVQSDVDTETIKANLDLMYKNPNYSAEYFSQNLSSALCLSSKFVENAFALDKLATPNGTKVFSDLNYLEEKFFTNDELCSNIKKYLPQLTDEFLQQNTVYDNYRSFTGIISYLETAGEPGFKNLIELNKLATPNGTKIFPNATYMRVGCCTDSDSCENIKKYLPQFSDELLKQNTDNKNYYNFAQYISRLNNLGEAGYKEAVEFQKLLEKDGKIDKYSYVALDMILGLSYLYDISNINELTFTDKKHVLHSLVATNTNLFTIPENLKKDFPLIPTNQEEYCSLLQNLVKSMGIETKPISDEQLEKFNQDISEFSELFQSSKVEDFEITQEISTKSLVDTIKMHTKDLSRLAKRQVYDYFGFEITPDGALKGYPANISNGKKLAQIPDEKTKAVIEELRPYIDKYASDNKVSFTVKGCDEQTANKLNELFNDIVEVLPEFRTTIEKTQHKTQSYDVAKHSLKVLQHIVRDDEYKALDESDKKVIFLAGLLHDITKAEGKVDKTHPAESAFDAFFITEKLHLSAEEKNKLYDLIRNHDWLEFANEQVKTGKDRTPIETEEEAKSRSEKAVRDYAFNMHTSNTFAMQKILTKADLKSVKADESFYTRFSEALSKHSVQIDEAITTLQQTQPMLPFSQLPKASEIKDGNGVYKTEDGNVVLKLNEIEDFESIGFPIGTNKSNFKFLVHGLDSEEQLSKFSTFAIVDSTALLSTSYVIKPHTEYRVFRPQGLIINTDTSNIHCGVNMDYGTGCGKNIENLKQNFLFGGVRSGDRSYFANLIKSKLHMSDKDYVEFVRKYSNKSLAEIEAIDSELGKKLITIFEEIELGNRAHGRSYNEVLVTRPQIKGVFLYDMNIPSQVGNPLDFLERETPNPNRQGVPALLKYAKEHDLPVVVLGD